VQNKPTNLILIWLFLILLLNAATGHHLEFIGSTLWSKISDIEANGDFLYCATKNGILILDIKDKNNPRVAGKYYHKSQLHQDIAVKDSFIYLPDGLNGLHIINVSDPREAFLAKTIKKPEYIRLVSLKGNTAYVLGNIVNGHSTLYVFDVSQGANPILISNLVIHQQISYPITMDIHDNLLCLSLKNNIYLIDIFNSSIPKILCEFPVENSCQCKFLDKKTLVCWDISSIRSLDISNLTEPIETAKYSNHMHIVDIDTKSNYVFSLRIKPDIKNMLQIVDNTLEIIDFNDSKQPLLKGSFDLYEHKDRIYNDRIFIYGDYAYVSAPGFGLQIFDITELNKPLLTGTYKTYDRLNNLVAKDNYAYVISGKSGLITFDISIPEYPDPISILSIPELGLETGIALRGELILLVQKDIGLQLIDISNPINPTLSKNFALKGHPINIRLRDDLAFITFEDQKSKSIQIHNISDLEHIQYLSTIDAMNLEGDFDISNDYVYIADGDSTVKIFDITDPERPLQISGLCLSQPAKGITICDNYAYVAPGPGITGCIMVHNYKTLILNIEDILTPSIIGECSIPNSMTSSRVSFLNDNYLVILKTSGGLVPQYNIFLIDLANPEKPFISELFKLSNPLCKIFTGDNYIYYIESRSAAYNQFGILEFEK